MNPDQTKGSESVPDPESKGRKRVFPFRLSEWAVGHPVLAVAVVSILAVVINCYPVIFCGRSFVSPACTGPLVYSSWPPLPGQNPGPARSQHGSDTGAMMVWGVPMGFLEARSLWQHHELPLWDRYGHAGSPLLGQAVSMLGDPLQCLVILGHGSAGAWDIKFLLAKFLFCAGFGLLLRRLLGNLPLSLLYAALAAYCGAFFYINNHMVFFVFAYAPWILLAAVGFLDLNSKQFFRWGLVWLLANFACFNAGHVEVAVVLIGGLNLAALAYALAVCRTLAERATMLGRLAAGTLLFAGLSAPAWLSFLAALPNSFSVHQAVKVYQLQPQCLPGVFDDLFYHLLLPKDALAAIAPGASLLVFSGGCLSVLRWRQLRAAPFFWVNTAAIVLWGGCVFGWVPALVLEAVPFLNRVGHNYIDFSYLLILHLTIQSAYGFLALARDSRLQRAAIDAGILALGLVALMLAFCLANQHRPVPWSYFLCAGIGAVGAPWLFAFFQSRSGRVSPLGWTAILTLAFMAQFRFGLYHLGNQDLLMLPGPREVLDAPSPAFDRIKTDRSGPFRVVGLDSSLLGDYAAVYDLEDIRSCAPLTSADFMTLILNYPGFSLNYGWNIKVTDPVAAQPLLNLLNVKYLLASPAVGLQPGLDFRLAERSDFGVLENLDVWPRAFFTDQISSNSSPGEFLNQLWAHAKKPFVSLAPAEMARLPDLGRSATTNPIVAAATGYQLFPNSTAFDVHAPTAGVVCLTEGQARDFTVTANGNPQPVLTVNRAFKGVYLDRPGDYHIRFTYRPRYWSLAGSLFFTAAGIVLALAGCHACRNWRMARRCHPQSAKSNDPAVRVAQ